MPPRLRAIPAVLALALLAAACTSGGDDGPSPAPTGSTNAQLSAQMATTDLYVGAPQRVGVGLILADGRLISYGSVDMRFSFVGTADAPQQPQPGPAATGVYLPTPGTSNSGASPAITQPSQARGIYEAENVTFDQAGFWQVDVIAGVQGAGSMRSSTTFPVGAQPQLPAPGQPALKTENLTIHSKGVPLAAIDSRAADGGTIPDPDLHEWTIAQALKEHRPIVVDFATPVYCTSQFCGPVTDEVDALAKQYTDRAVFIHVEIWHDFQKQEINQAAADWLYRNGDLTEPWLYLIGSDGTIQDRWSVLFRKQELEAALKTLPPMKG